MGADLQASRKWIGFTAGIYSLQEENRIKGYTFKNRNTEEWGEKFKNIVLNCKMQIKQNILPSYRAKLSADTASQFKLSSSVAQSCLTPCDPMDCSTPGMLSITNWSLFKLMSIESVMPSNHLSLCRPFLPPSTFPSIRVFSSESVLRIRWPKDWSFSFSISPSNEYSGLISFRINWLDLLAVQGTRKSLQHHRSKASILRCSAFFIVQLSHPYKTAGRP